MGFASNLNAAIIEQGVQADRNLDLAPTGDHEQIFGHDYERQLAALRFLANAAGIAAMLGVSMYADIKDRLTKV